MGEVKLSPIVFNFPKYTQDELNDSDIGSAFKNQLSEKINELEQLYPQRNEDNIKEIWRQTLENFSQYELTDCVEKRFFSYQFSEFAMVFDLRKARAIGKYNILDDLHKSSSEKENKETIIQEFTEQILSYQNQLYACYSSLDSKENRSCKEIFQLTCANLHKKIALAHFFQIKYEIEDEELFKSFEDDKLNQFELRKNRLLFLYNNLSKFYSTKESEKIQQLVDKIFNKQNELVACYEKLTKEQKNETSWDTVFKLNVEYFFNKENVVLDKILSIWKKTNYENNCIAKLRAQIFNLYHLLSEVPVESSFEEIISTLDEILSKNKINDGLLQSLWEIFSLVTLAPDKEKRLFETLSKSSGSPEIQFEVKFKLFCFQHYCKKLRAIYTASQNSKSKVEGKKATEVDSLMQSLNKVLHSLGKHYSEKNLLRKDWEDVYHCLAAEQFPLAQKDSLLRIFLEYKESPSSILETAPNFLWQLPWNIVALPFTLLQSFRSSVEDGEALWKGEKYLIILKSHQDWVLANDKNITEWLKEDKGNREGGLKEKVIEIITYMKEMKFPKIPLIPTKKQKGKYNETLREKNETYLTMLRAALSLPEFNDAFESFSSIGSNKTRGAATILIQLCNQRFTGVNMVPFTTKLMEELIDIGLHHLSEMEINYKLYCNREIYPSSLSIGTEVIRKAVEKIPDEHKIPLFDALGMQILNKTNIKWDLHLQGAPSFYLLKMKFIENLDVQWLRFPSPTSSDLSDGIIPEFLGFIKDKRTLLCTLQSSDVEPEASRTKHIFGLNYINSNKTTVAVFPVCDSDLFNQTGEFADLKENEPRFPTRIAFFSEILKTIIPNPKSANSQKGNYMFPHHLLKNEKFKEMVEQCLNNTSDVFFNSAQELNVKQRRAFIKYFNVLLDFDLIKFTKSNYFAIFCNHSADRTGVLVTLTWKILLIAFEKEDQVAFKIITKTSKNEDIERSYTWGQVVEAFIDGPAMLIAKREMNEEYYVGLLEALEILKDADVRKKIIENREKVFGILGFEFPFSNQTVTSENKEDTEEKQ